MAELEATFRCPVIESYGMTEAAHQMASTPLPPRRAQAGFGRHCRRARYRHHGARRRAGSVRRRRRDRHPRAERHVGLREQSRGQPHRFRPWLVPHRDQGTMDAGGMSGSRPVEEIINRGGREDLPARVDEVLMDTRRSRKWSPSPCRTTSSARTLPRRSCSVMASMRPSARSRDSARDGSPTSRCRAHRVLPEIPKGATGKLQRIGLAAKLGLG